MPKFPPLSAEQTLTEFPSFPPAEIAILKDDVVHLGPNGELLLRVEDAARRLHVSRAQLYRLLGSGQIASVKIGASRRVPVRCLHEYVDRLIGEQS
jgi:excisionase family DNA binding protein